MTFAGVNYLAVLVAAFVAWIAGAIYYTTLSKPWIAAQGWTADDLARRSAATKGTTAAWLPFVVVFVAEIVMAWVLAGLLGHLGPGQVTVRNGIVSALFVWVGFIAATIVPINMFGARKLSLSVLDSGHWLLVTIVMGLVLGAFGA